MTHIAIIIDTTDLWTPPPTWQDDAAVLGLVVMSGEAEVTAPAAPLLLTACTATFLPVSQAVNIRFREANAVAWLVDDADVTGLTLDSILPVDETAATVIHDVFFEHQRPEFHQASALRFVCHQLQNRDIETTDPQTSDQLVAHVVAYMQAHLDEPITLEILEQESGCSKTVLAKRFQSELGETPIRALARLRLDHARHLLQSTDLTISQIAHATGYKDLAGFSHFFKQHAGQSPSEFRNNCRWLV